MKIYFRLSGKLSIGIALLLLPGNISFAQPGWFVQNSGTNAVLVDVCLASVNTAYAVGQAGTILKTTNSGMTWESQTSGTTENLLGVWFSDENTGTAVGENGTIRRTANGGTTWTSQASGTLFVLYRVQFIGANIGYIVGNDGNEGIVLKTTNGGTNWTSLPIVEQESFTALSFVDENTGTIVGNSNIQRTTDGGITWTVQFSGSFYGVSFADANNGLAAGYYIYRTTNGGANWEEVLNTANIRDVFMVNSNLAFAVGTAQIGNESRIYRTTNGGNNWEEQVLNPVSSVLYSVFFINEYVGAAVGNGGRIYWTIDGGTPVELTSFEASVIVNDVILNWTTATEINNQGFEVERSQKTEVGSQNWETIGFVPGFGTTTEPKSYSFSDNDLSSGKYSYRLKQIDFDGSFEYLQEIEVDVFSPMEFVLYQNYPNPFNPTTIISWQSPVGSHQSLMVYDILGNEVATLVDEYKPAGKYEIEFNASGLTSGVFFYKLQMESFVQIRKMILIK
jgi:photosystem II stability/assembly factor-like uncharacterized protein